MKATTTKTAITKALLRIVAVAGAAANTTHAGVLIIIGDPFNGITFQRTTIDFTLSTAVEAECDEDFRAAIDFTKFQTLANRLAVEEVELSILPSTVEVKCGQSRTRFNRWLATELPRDLDEIEALGVIELTTKELEHSLKVCEPTIYKTPDRPALRGICLIAALGYLQFVAADGKRLHLRRLLQSEEPVNAGPDGKDRGLTIPDDVVQVIKKAFFGDPGPIFIQCDDSRLKISSVTSSVICAQISEQFVNFAPLYVSGSTNAIHVDRKHLKEVLGRAAATEDQYSKVTFEVSLENVMIRTDDERGSSSVETLECTTELDPGEFKFNRKYLLELIDIIEEDTVSLEFHEMHRLIVRDLNAYGILIGFVQ